MERSYAAAVSGSGNVVAVSGDGGSGKSRLLLEASRKLVEQGAQVAAGHCLEYVQSSYAPFLAAMQSLADANPGILASAGSTKLVLARVLPELAESSGAAPAADIDKLRFFDSFVDALRRFATAKPVVMVIEDIHWADNGSLDLLQHLTASIADARALVIVSLRSEDLAQARALRSAIAKLERRATFHRIELEPLTESEMHALVFDAAEDAGLPAVTVGAICAQSEGNPLFAEELLKTATEGIKGSRLPATLREAVLDRFALLDDGAKHIVSVAAVFGRTFAPEFLAQTTGAANERVIAALKEAIRLALVFEERGGGGSFSFRHELTRASIYGELLEAEARTLHGKIAAALEEAGPGVHAAELARHWWDAGQPARAASYYERAGDAALNTFAYRDAVTAFDRALEHGRHEPAQRAALNLKLATALHQSGFESRAIRATQAALTYFESVGDREEAAATCLQLAWLRSGYGDIDEGLALTQKAIEWIRDDSASPAYFDAHVLLMQQYCEFRWDPNNFSEHKALAERATGEQSVATRARFLLLSAQVAVDLGNLQEAGKIADDAVALALQHDDARSAVRAQAGLAIALAEDGEAALAEQSFAKVNELMESRHIGGLTGAWVVLLLARAKLLAGELEHARTLLLYALTHDIETTIFRVNVARTGIPLGLALEDDALVRRCARKDVLEFALHSKLPAAIGAAADFAEDLVVRERSHEASSLLRRALESLDRIKALPGPGAIESLACAIARIGESSDAPAARRYLAQTAATSNARSTAAMLTLFDAHAAARSDDRASLTRNGEAAAQAFHEIGWPLHEAQALELLGRHKEALDVYRRTGDTRDSRRLEIVVNPVNKRGRAKGEMTAREREICALLVQGKTNKAIAETLVVSERTVESHVSSILMKLGAASRAELIAKLKT